MKKIAFIGGGNMARSIIGGLLERGIAATNMSVAEPHEPFRSALEKDFSVRAFADNTAAVIDAEIWLLAVKPQMMGSALAPLREAAIRSAPLVISVAAGIPIARLRELLGEQARYVRTMPNTPALIGEGITALFAEAAVDEIEKKAAEELLQACGPTVWIGDESLMDVVTATSGSGPAYFFLLMEQMIASATALGLPAQTARKLVLQTALGAAKMAATSTESIRVLRERVTSPGGTTAAALNVFAQYHFNDSVLAALTAATTRGCELAKAGD
jgi:pyrroline-5-carboxylate reductase